MLDDADFAGALDSWGREFAGRTDSLEATWALAEIEERWGDSLFFGGEAGGAAHYRAAQRALVPQGAMFSSREENDRRMLAFGRLTNKLYAIGADGKPRSRHDAQPHPNHKPIVRRAPVPEPPPQPAPAPPPQPAPKPVRKPAPQPPEPSIAERREAALYRRRTRERRETELGQLFGQTDHWRHYALASMWLDAAKALAANHPRSARYACQWSAYHFELYNQEWTTHLPASRWDSDGAQEMSEVHDFENALPPAREEPPPEWVALLLDGYWRRAFASIPPGPPPPEFAPLLKILADACRTAGRPGPGEQVSAS